jgi:hypothetical protein
VKMAWPGNWSGNYIPLGSATAKDDGTIERTNAPPDDLAIPLMDNSPPYNPGLTQSPPTGFEFQRRPVVDRTSTDRTDRSSSATLLGGDYFQCMSLQASVTLNTL